MKKAFFLYLAVVGCFFFGGQGVMADHVSFCDGAGFDEAQGAGKEWGAWCRKDAVVAFEEGSVRGACREWENWDEVDRGVVGWWKGLWQSEEEAIEGIEAKKERYDRCRYVVGSVLANREDRGVGVDDTLLKAEGVVRSFKEFAHRWVVPLMDHARQIFIWLFTVEFVVVFGMLLVSQELAFGSFMKVLMPRLIIGSIGFYLLSKPLFVFEVLDWFREVVLDVGSGFGEDIAMERDHLSVEESLLLLPAKVFALIVKASGFDFTLSLSGFAAPFLSPGDFFGKLVMLLPYLVAGFFVLWALSVIALQLVVVLCEIHITLLVGMFSLAFYSLEFTRPMTLGFFKAVLGLGFKLMTLEFLIFLIMDMIEGWAYYNFTGHGLMPVLVMVTLSMMFKELVVKIPNAMQALFGGGLSSGVSADGVGRAVAWTTTAGVAAAAGGIGGAARLGIGAVGVAAAEDPGFGSKGFGGKVASALGSGISTVGQDWANSIKTGMARQGVGNVAQERMRQALLKTQSGGSPKF